MITGRNLAKILLALASFALAVPARAAVVDVTGTSTKLGWTAATGAVASYGVFVSKNGAAFPASPNQVVTTPEATVTAATGDTLVVKVAAYDASGTKGPDSASSDSLHFIAAPGPPPPPDPVPTLPALTLSTTSLTVGATQGVNPPAQSFTIRNTGGGSLAYLTAYSHSWIVLSNSAGSATTETDTVDVAFATADLPAGSYTGTITVLHSGTPTKEQYITVHLTVAAPPPAAAAISLSTSSLTASVEKGKDAAAASFTVRNSGGGTLGYAVSESASWLSLTPASGSSTGESDTIGVSYATASLDAGTHTTMLTVSASGAPAKTVAVSVTVSPGTPILELSTTSVDAAASPGESPSGQSLTVRNAGAGTLAYAITSDQSWVTLSPASGNSTGEADPIGLTFSTASLAAGTHQATLTVSATGLASRTISVSLRLAGAGVSFDLDGDGSSDALFRHADGSVSGWLMSSTAIRSSVSVPAMDATWTLAGTGDFDGDGKSFDFLWLQPSSGNVMIALNAGSTQKGLGSVGTVGGGWRVGGVADFDADGKSDVLWIDPTTGGATAWLVDRLSLKAVRAIGSMGAGWDVAATGDFDGDRKADVLLERTGSPDLMLWLLDGTTVRQAIPTAIPLGPGWTVVAAGDFAADGHADIAVFSPAIGFFWVLAGYGPGFAPTAIVDTTSASSSFAAAGAYDASGKRGLLVSDAASGSVSAWRFEGSWFKTATALGSLDSSWTVLGEKGTAR